MAIVNTQIIENINITDNGTYDVARYTEANVNVVPKYCIQKTKDANNKIEMGSSVIDLTGATDLGDRVLYCAYYLNPNVSGAVDMSSITSISGEQACKYMFCALEQSGYDWDSSPLEITSHITSVDLSGLTSITGNNACQHMFYDCKNIQSIDLSNLTNIYGNYACNNMFCKCTSLTGKVDLSSLTTINATTNTATNYHCSYMFNNCSGITSVDLSGLTIIGPSTKVVNQWGEMECRNTFSNAFSYCTNLTSADLSGLTEIRYATGSFEWAFYNSNKLETIDISNLTTILGYQPFYAFITGTKVASLSFDKLSDLGAEGCGLSGSCRYATYLRNLYLPSLTIASFHGLTNHFEYMFDGSNNVTMHLPSSLDPNGGSNIITSQNGYPNFGGSNITILFDLPATE